MNRVFTMKDRRLIEALDYIDDEYIASAAPSPCTSAYSPGESISHCPYCIY